MEIIKKDTELWEKISNFQLDNPEAAFSFTKRLSRENGWSLDYSKRVVDEYKKFIYLSVISGKSLTPSEEVDQAWHLHLIYSKSYWVDFCKNVLGGINFHHGPTKGGHAEGEKYNNQYEYTMSVYRQVFGVNPPVDIWPDTQTRFSNVNFRRVSVKDNFILNKKKVTTYMLSYVLLPIVIILAGLLMSAESEVEVNWQSVLVGMVIILVILFIIRGIYRYITKNNRDKNDGSGGGGDGGCTVLGAFFGCGSSGCSGSSGCGSSGCGGGGCGGCGGCGG